jgi:hypothetical protein
MPSSDVASDVASVCQGILSVKERMKLLKAAQPVHRVQQHRRVEKKNTGSTKIAALQNKLQAAQPDPLEPHRRVLGEKNNGGNKIAALQNKLKLNIGLPNNPKPARSQPVEQTVVSAKKRPSAKESSNAIFQRQLAIEARNELKKRQKRQIRKMRHAPEKTVSESTFEAPPDEVFEATPFKVDKPTEIATPSVYMPLKVLEPAGAAISAMATITPCFDLTTSR